jgi:hypothetical protein
VLRKEGRKEYDNGDLGRRTGRKGGRKELEGRNWKEGGKEGRRVKEGE